MKWTYFLLLTLSAGIFSLTSCSTSDNPERIKAYNEMMAIHDEVMPEMGTIHRLEKSLKKKIDNTTSPDSLIMMKATLKRLKESGEGMMDWMHKLEVPSKKVPDEKAIAYMKSEKENISMISIKMKKSILSSKAILGE